MKILLVGEYSRLHNSLKEGLQKNGHNVTIIGNGDVFKKYPVDINIDGKTIKNNFFLHTLRQLIFRITTFDIASVETYIRCMYHQKELKKNDVVQFINETPFNIGYYFERRLLKFLFRHNDAVFLSACGDDYQYISYSLSGKFPYSTLSPLLKDPSLKKIYKQTLKHISKNQKKLHDFVFEHIKAVIPASVEYNLAYHNTAKAVPMIPNAVNIDKIEYHPLEINSKINILHGINSSNYHKKGNNHFEDALEIIQKKYGDKVKIKTVRDMPYTEYIPHFLSAHIVLDQTYAHDQGYNALEAMAMGKVVFTGAGQYFNSYYNINSKVAVDTTPNSTKIANDIENLILSPNQIIEIGKEARSFIEEKHNYIKIAKKYENTWLKYSKKKKGNLN